MKITKALVSGIAVLALAGTLAACGDDSDDKSESNNSSQATQENALDSTEQAPADDEAADDAPEVDDADVSTGGSTAVTIDGEELAGFDPEAVTCVKADGKITVGSADTTSGLGIVMTDEATPQVESLGIMVDGVALAVASMSGAEVGSADVVVDGDTYTVTGMAEGADTANPTEMVKKEFEIVVTCS